MTYDDFHNFCIKTIKKYPKKTAIKMISDQKGPLTGKKLGFEKAEQMYYIFVDKYCIKYDFEKHDNNYSAYVNEKNKILKKK